MVRSKVLKSIFCLKGIILNGIYTDIQILNETWAMKMKNFSLQLCIYIQEVITWLGEIIYKKLLILGVAEIRNTKINYEKVNNFN